jgi:hypothetical protein
MRARAQRARRALALGLAGAAAAAHAGDAPGRGAYCPLPEPGERPACLEPARAQYAGFFEGLASGSVDDAGAAALEADVAAGAASERAYLALSSLAYGYYLMAERAARLPHASPEVRARLERWNELLAAAYAASPGDPAYRAALHEAAADLHRRAPPAALRCLDATGAAARCDSTEAVLRTLSHERDRSGIRGALRSAVERVRGPEPSRP